MNFSIKPKSAKINVENLTPDMIEGYVKASEVTRSVCKEMSRLFDTDLHKQIDGDTPFMFVVLKTREYDVISCESLMSVLNDTAENISKGTTSTHKFKACYKHFVKYLVKVHLKAEKSPPAPALSSLQIKR